MQNASCQKGVAKLREEKSASQARTFHNKTLHNKILEFLGRGVFTVKATKNLEKKSVQNLAENRAQK